MFFYPDGTTSTAELLLRNEHNMHIRVALRERRQSREPHCPPLPRIRGEQIVDPLAGGGARFDELRVAAHVVGE